MKQVLGLEPKGEKEKQVTAGTTATEGKEEDEEADLDIAESTGYPPHVVEEWQEGTAEGESRAASGTKSVTSLLFGKFRKKGNTNTPTKGGKEASPMDVGLGHAHPVSNPEEAASTTREGGAARGGPQPHGMTHEEAKRGMEKTRIAAEEAAAGPFKTPAEKERESAIEHLGRGDLTSEDMTTQAIKAAKEGEGGPPSAAETAKGTTQGLAARAVQTGKEAAERVKETGERAKEVVQEKLPSVSTSATTPTQPGGLMHRIWSSASRVVQAVQGAPEEDTHEEPRRLREVAEGVRERGREVVGGGLETVKGVTERATETGAAAVQAIQGGLEEEEGGTGKVGEVAEEAKQRAREAMSAAAEKTKAAAEKVAETGRRGLEKAKATVAAPLEGRGGSESPEGEGLKQESAKVGEKISGMVTTLDEAAAKLWHAGERAVESVQGGVEEEGVSTTTGGRQRQPGERFEASKEALGSGVGRATEAMREAVRGTGQVGGGVVEGAKGVAQKASQAVTGTAIGAVEKGKEVVEAGKEKIGTIAEKGKETLGKVTEKGARAVGAVQGEEDSLETGELGEMAEHAKERVREDVEGFLEKASEMGARAVAMVQGDVEETVEAPSTSELAEHAKERLVEIAKDVVEKVTETGSKAVSMVQGGVEENVEASMLSEMAEHAKEKLMAPVKGATEMLSSATEKISETGGKAVSMVQGGVEESMEAPTMGEMAEHVKERVVEAVAGVTEKLSETGSKAVDMLQGSVEEGLEGPTIGDVVEHSKERLVETATGAFETVSEKGSKMVEAVQGGLGKELPTPKPPTEYLKGAGERQESVERKPSGFISKLFDTAARLVDKIQGSPAEELEAPAMATAMERGMEGAEEAVGEAGKKAVQWAEPPTFTGAQPQAEGEVGGGSAGRAWDRAAQSLDHLYDRAKIAGEFQGAEGRAKQELMDELKQAERVALTSLEIAFSISPLTPVLLLKSSVIMQAAKTPAERVDQVAREGWFAGREEVTPVIVLAPTPPSTPCVPADVATLTQPKETYEATRATAIEAQGVVAGLVGQLKAVDEHLKSAIHEEEAAGAAREAYRAKKKETEGTAGPDPTKRSCTTAYERGALGRA